MTDYDLDLPYYPVDFEKDPDGVKLLRFDWARELDGDTIASVDYLLPDGLTEGTNGGTGSYRTVKVSGGTAGNVYRVTCRITTTTSAETMDKTYRVLVREQ